MQRKTLDSGIWTWRICSVSWWRWCIQEEMEAEEGHHAVLILVYHNRNWPSRPWAGLICNVNTCVSYLLVFPPTTTMVLILGLFAMCELLFMCFDPLLVGGKQFLWWYLQTDSGIFSNQVLDSIGCHWDQRSITIRYLLWVIVISGSLRLHQYTTTNTDSKIKVLTMHCECQLL